MFIGRETNPPDHHQHLTTILMSSTFDLSGFSNDQIKSLFVALQQEIEKNEVTFDDKVQTVRQQRMDARMSEIARSIAIIESTNAAFEVCLNEILGDIEESRFIVSQLDKCRRENDFRRFNSVYFKYSGKDLKVEEMLRTLAAIYRLKMKDYSSPSLKSKDRSIVRKEIRCPHCGEYAAKLVAYLDIKGIKWAS
jgi:hypothetical protein